MQAALTFSVVLALLQATAGFYPGFTQSYIINQQPQYVWYEPQVEYQEEVIVINPSEYDFYQINPGQTYHFIQQPEYQTIIIQEEPQQIIIDTTPRTVQPKRNNVQQENDPVETMQLIKKSNADIDAIFTNAAAEIERSNEKSFNHALTARLAIPEMARQISNKISSQSKDLNECLQEIDRQTKETAEAYKVLGLQCIAEAEAVGDATRAAVNHALQADYDTAEGQNEIDSENLSMCASSQFKLCAAERKQLQQSMSGADAAAKIHMAQARDGAASQMKQIAQCWQSSIEDYDDMLDDIEDGINSCQS